MVLNEPKKGRSLTRPKTASLGSLAEGKPESQPESKPTAKESQRQLRTDIRSLKFLTPKLFNTMTANNGKQLMQQTIEKKAKRVIARE